MDGLSELHLQLHVFNMEVFHFGLKLLKYFFGSSLNRDLFIIIFGHI